MTAALLLYVFAVTAKQDGTVVRASCGESEAVLGQLAAGTPVEIRFAVADGSSCVKVQAGGVVGYVEGRDLAGLDEFERARRSGAAVGQTATPEPAPVLPAVKMPAGNPNLDRAMKLVDANQPQEALDLMAPSLRESRPDANVLLVAGLAAYRADDLRGALDYWRASLAQRPNEQLAALCERVERESHADGSGEKLYGYRFLLRYEGTTVPPDLARSMVTVLDEEFSRISVQLGCPANDRIPVIVQNLAAYRRTTGAAEWSGGQYDGRIHIALVEGASIGRETRRLFAHEIVHACLANIGKWPAWLQEGMAQRLSGDVLGTGERAEIEELIHAHALPKLERLGEGWGRMDAAHARLAYRLALAAADALYDSYAEYGVANVLRAPERLPQVTAEIDRRLGL